MENRDVEQLFQPFFDDEAFWRLDILKVDATEAGTQVFNRINEFFRVLGRDEKIDPIDIREALEQRPLALHHRLGCQRPQVTQSQDGRAVGDNGYKVALVGIIVGSARIFGNRHHRNRDAGRISKR
jgi:hypothetical protein